MKVKAILLDVDNTLTRTDGHISERTIESLKKLHVNGFTVGVCTGRSFAALNPYILKHFPQEALHVVNGGGEIIATSGQTKWIKDLPSRLVKHICKNTVLLGGDFAFGKEDTLYCSSGLVEQNKKHTWGYKVRLPRNVREWNTPLISIANLNPKVIAFIESQSKISWQIIEKGENDVYCDITSIGINKATGVKNWLKIHSLDRRELLVIGDSENDIALFQFAETKIAMGNSHSSLKRLADLVIGHTDHDGLAVYLESLV
ncbi:HAD family phosphatase [Candidatus Peregrinibacteria bacterium]|nr:HAD family phosphatase [bacterium]NCQ54609.1 HAD family phosphatase [Candidatus Parcubacteria bacterium]NCS68088.1 HAD family phosphatase [Candidatus Peregrinibacteria bacterium]